MDNGKKKNSDWTSSVDKASKKYNTKNINKNYGNHEQIIQLLEQKTLKL